jgi:hypothetical protein
MNFEPQLNFVKFDHEFYFRFLPVDDLFVVLLVGWLVNTEIEEPFFELDLVELDLVLMNNWNTLSIPVVSANDLFTMSLSRTHCDGVDADCSAGLELETTHDADEVVVMF